MRRRMIALLCAGMLLLCACGGNTDTGNAPVSSGGNAVSTDAGQGQQTEGFCFRVGDAHAAFRIAVDTPMEETLSFLGEAKSYFEAPSCAFEGVDKTYTYSDFVVDTYPVNGVDMISRIFLSNDLVQTEEGLAIGMSRQDMLDRYGTDYAENGTECIYTNGNMKLRVILEDDRVKTITYTSIAAESEF